MALFQLLGLVNIYFVITLKKNRLVIIQALKKRHVNEAFNLCRIFPKLAANVYFELPILGRFPKINTIPSKPCTYTEIASSKYIVSFMFGKIPLICVLYKVWVGVATHNGKISSSVLRLLVLIGLPINKYIA